MADQRVLDMPRIDVAAITGAEVTYIDTGAADGGLDLDGLRNWLKTQNLDMIECVFAVGAAASLVAAFHDIQVPYDAKVLEWAIVGDATGNIVIDIYQCTHAQYDGGSTHPVAGDSICNGDPPKVASAKKGQVTNVGGSSPAWLDLVGGSWIRFVVSSSDSPATMSNVTISLKVRHKYSTGDSP